MFKRSRREDGESTSFEMGLFWRVWILVGGYVDGLVARQIPCLVNHDKGELVTGMRKALERQWLLFQTLRLLNSHTLR